MAKRGAKKKPDHMKVISGTDQPCRMNPDAPAFDDADGNLQPPEWLSDVESIAEWERLAPMLKKSGVLTEADRSMLAALCQVWGDYLRNVKARLPVTSAMITQMRALYSEFGLTPASRGNVKAAPTNKVLNPFGRNGRR